MQIKFGLVSLNSLKSSEGFPKIKMDPPSIVIYVPNNSIIEAAARDRRQIRTEGAPDAFRKIICLTALASPVSAGHFKFKVNNSKNNQLKFLFRHQAKACTSSLNVCSKENEIQLSFSGDCSCSLDRAATIASKLKFVKNWQGENDWVKQAKEEDSAQTLCIFGFEDESSSDGAESSDDKITQPISSIEKLSTTSDDGCECGCEAGCVPGCEELTCIKKFFFKMFCSKKPSRKTEKTRTIYYGN